MRIYRAIRLGQMCELGNFGNLFRLARLTARDAGHVDDPAVLHANLAILRFRQCESNPTAAFRGFGCECQLGHALIIRVVHQRLLGMVEDLRFIGRVIVDTAMPIKMVVSDIGDRRAIQLKRIGEMQLERTELNTQHIICRIDCGMGHRFADIADSRCGQTASRQHLRSHFRSGGLAIGTGDANPLRRMPSGIAIHRSCQASSTSLITGMPRRCASRMNGVLGLNTGEVITRST